MNTTIRTFVYLDSLQPQVASFMQTISQGFLPLENQSSLLTEVAPGMTIHPMMDRILKQTEVAPGFQLVERTYGVLEVHHEDQGQIWAAGDALLDYCGLKITDRSKPFISTHEIIHNVDNRQTALLNRMRHGNFLLKHSSLFILETEPAGYIYLAANEAEKASPIDILEFRFFGALGRLYIGGNEAEIEEASHAARRALASIA